MRLLRTLSPLCVTLLFIVVLAIGMTQCLGQSPSETPRLLLLSKQRVSTPQTLKQWWLPSLPLAVTSQRRMLLPMVTWHPPMNITTILSSDVALRSRPSPVSVATPTTTTTSTTAPVTIATAPISTQSPSDTVTPYEREEWSRVAQCEEGGNWSFNGPLYSGGLGISRDNWREYGGLAYAPVGAEASEDDQIMVAENIQFDPPDQGYCAPW